MHQRPTRYHGWYRQTSLPRVVLTSDIDIRIRLPWRSVIRQIGRSKLLAYDAWVVDILLSPSKGVALEYLTMEELEAGLDEIHQSPKDEGRLELIVRRPALDEREVLEEGELDLRDGLVGDSWRTRGSSRTPDGSPHPDMQLNVMNSRVIALVAGDKVRWQLAGDQLFIDMDLSAENLPPGTRLRLGSAVIEVTNQPHTGCKKFVARFGLEAMKFVNSPLGKQLHLRGINARVVQPGVIRVGEVVRKI